MSYPEQSVGARMDFEMVTIRDDVTLEVVLRYLRRFDELPDQTDQVFIVDRDDHGDGRQHVGRSEQRHGGAADPRALGQGSGDWLDSAADVRDRHAGLADLSRTRHPGVALTRDGLAHAAWRVSSLQGIALSAVSICSVT